MSGARELKRNLLSRLATADWESSLPAMSELGQQAISPLFSGLCSTDVSVRWRSITAFGSVVSAMAAKTPEKARVVMRRFIWSLNDESGGIGWGAPEAMAEIMAVSPIMAAEYHNHLLAYIHEDHCRPDCFLEHAPLRRGAVWGVGRLSQVRPDLTRSSAEDLLCALNDCDPVIRGFAAWTVGILQLSHAATLLEAMSSDQTSMEIYRDRVLIQTTPATLAGEALLRITDHRSVTD